VRALTQQLRPDTQLGRRSASKSSRTVGRDKSCRANRFGRPLASPEPTQHAPVFRANRLARAEPCATPAPSTYAQNWRAQPGPHTGKRQDERPSQGWVQPRKSYTELQQGRMLVPEQRHHVSLYQASRSRPPMRPRVRASRPSSTESCAAVLVERMGARVVAATYTSSQKGAHPRCGCHLRGAARNAGRARGLHLGCSTDAL